MKRLLIMRECFMAAMVLPQGVNLQLKPLAQEKVGERLKKLDREHRIIAVTRLGSLAVDAMAVKSFCEKYDVQVTKDGVLEAGLVLFRDRDVIMIVAGENGSEKVIEGLVTDIVEGVSPKEPGKKVDHAVAENGC